MTDVQIVNGIAMPPLYNKRAGEMWDIISAHVDFAGKRVIDLGCGRGDLALRVSAMSAVRWVQAYDNNAECILDCESKKQSIKHRVTISFKLDDIGEAFHYKTLSSCDILICCSVLPYMPFASQFIDKMAHHAPMSIIECQYAGDGPGFPDIKDDDDMQTWLLSAGWSTVTPIGKTFVEGRDKWRTIWMCER